MCALHAEKIKESGGLVTRGGHTWFAGETLPNDKVKEFNEDMRFPLKDLSSNFPCPVKETHFCYNLRDIDQVSEFLGIPWEASKDIPFSESPTFIGLIWNLTNHTVSLTESKQQKYLGAISEWEHRRTHTLQDMQKLHGKLLHVSLIFPPNHTYLTNLEAMLSIFGDKPFKPRTPLHDTPEDLRWWREVLSLVPSPSIPIPSSQRIIDLQAFSNASSSVGITIVIGGCWHAWHLVGNWKKNGQDIASAKSVGFELLTQTIIGTGATSLHLKVFGDNVGVVKGWANGCSRSKQVNKSFRRIHSLLQVSQCQIIGRYVPSTGNLANCPS